MDPELNWIESELLSGKFLILPPALYDKAIEEVRAAGMKEEAIKNISKSSMLPPEKI